MLVLGACTSAPAAVDGGRYIESSGEVRVALVQMPFHGERNIAEQSGGPAYLAGGDLEVRLVAAGAALRPMETAKLTEEEQALYGEQRRMGLANWHLAELVERNERSGALSIGLLASCTSLLGMLAGLQQSGWEGQPVRVGLVFIDAHGDFNTPETSLSGMLGGMPVAVAAGLALQNLRTTSGLMTPIAAPNIVLGAARDLDSLEAELLEQHHIRRISVDDLRDRSGALHRMMRDLSAQTDLIYVHIDMDVLDPGEVPGHPLTVPGGPTSAELGDALRQMFQYDRVAALGIASTPYGERDPDGVSRKAAYALATAAVEGVRLRTQSDSVLQP